ncbi:MAG: hypothetical protein JSW71_18280 [Gemmatimonadota bacterium]|nr:MAG: hypothetical protein JSW71_18280 [Gemmatimonadota bacterium]
MSLLPLTLVIIQVSVWNVTPASVTVADTVTLSLRLVTAAGMEIHPDPLAPSAELEPLSMPVVRHVGGAVIVEYKVAFFEPGRRGVAMPEMQFVYEDGSVEQVLGDTAWVDVVSVLPDHDTIPPPRPSLGPFVRERTRPDIAVLLVACVAGCVIVWGIHRRRAGERPVWKRGSGRRIDAPVVPWLNAGEYRAVVSAVTDRLRESIATALPQAGRQLSVPECLAVVEREQPGWPADEIAGVLNSLDRARFAPIVPSDIMALVEQADELAISLRRIALEDAAP